MELYKWSGYCEMRVTVFGLPGSGNVLSAPRFVVPFRLAKTGPLSFV